MTTQSHTTARAVMLKNLDLVRMAWEQSHPHRLPLLDAAEMDGLTFQISHAAALGALDLMLLRRVAQPVIIVVSDERGGGPAAWSNLTTIAAFAAAAIVAAAPYRAETYVAACEVARVVKRLVIIETTPAARPAWLTELSDIVRSLQ